MSIERALLCAVNTATVDDVYSNIYYDPKFLSHFAYKSGFVAMYYSKQECFSHSYI